jgi:hypothetical protein
MLDLKPLYDAARADSDKMQTILKDMETAFAEGTEEGKAKALELRPALDQAKIEAEQANQLYISMRDAASVSDQAAKLFVPAGSVTNPSGADATTAKEMTRAAFEGLDAEAQMKFMKAGGKIVEAATE